MDETTKHEQPHTNGAQNSESIADQLQRESERLRQLAEELKKREAAHAEMIANYPFFKEFVYAELRKMFKDEDDFPEDEDLESWAKREGAMPLEAFIDDLENPKELP